MEACPHLNINRGVDSGGRGRGKVGEEMGEEKEGKTDMNKFDLKDNRKKRNNFLKNISFVAIYNLSHGMMDKCTKLFISSSSPLRSGYTMISFLRFLEAEQRGPVRCSFSMTFYLPKNFEVLPFSVSKTPRNVL